MYLLVIENLVTIGLQEPKPLLSLRYKLIRPNNVGGYSCTYLVGALCVLTMMHGHASVLVSVVRKPSLVFLFVLAYINYK